MVNSFIFLTFHGIGKPHKNAPSGEDPYWIERDAFCRVLDEVRSRPEVRITFDDGNRSDLEFAMPALKARNLKGEFFVVSDRIDEEGYLSRIDLMALIAEGMTIGHHGMYHQPWATLGPDALQAEIFGARSALQEACNTEVGHSACPLGSYNRSVIALLRRAGFKRVYTSDGGAALPTDWLVPRNTITKTEELAKVRTALSAKPFSAVGLKRRLKMLIKRWR